jgi:1-acyl-sn-glycerol-3-phosphate acyltransferase
MLAKLTAWALLALIRLLTGAQARWWGCPPKAEQRIYFANHQSHIDLVMIWAALPEELRSITRPIAARDYWANTPFKRWITTEVFHAIYVERGGSAPVAMPAATASAAPPAAARERVEPTFLEGLPPRVAPAFEAAIAPAPEPVQAPAPATERHSPASAQFEMPLLLPDVAIVTPPAADVPSPSPSPSSDALAPLQPLIDALQSGDSIIIFPEGTRGHTGEPQKFKSGLYTLAQMFPEAVLVPAWIDNVQRVMPKGEVVPVPILCSVTFGAPLRLEAGEERRPFLDRAREAVVALRDV